jgi:FkbM family methyltransferase
LQWFWICNVFSRLFPARNPTERARREFLAIALADTDVAIDCGANVGDVTEHLGRSGATVYAFEPNPHAFKVLEERFAGQQNVHCLQQGVLDRNDIRRLYFHESSDEDELHWSTGSSLLDYKGNVRKDKYVDTPVIDLSEFIQSLHSRVKVLKIDVEGVEGAILRKLITTGMIHRVDHVFVETHERKVPELKADTDELRQILRTMKLTHVNLDWT